MAGPWTKYDEDDEWIIKDDVGEIIAVVETELLANVLLAWLTGVYGDPPDFPVDTPISESSGEDVFYCRDCNHEATEEEFWPSDGNPAPHVCPKCGRTNIYYREDG